MQTNRTLNESEQCPPDLSDYMSQLEKDISSLNTQIKHGHAMAYMQQQEDKPALTLEN